MLHSLRDLADPDLGPTDRLVMAMMLAHREGEGANVFAARRGASAPSVAQLVRSTGLSERAVQTSRTKLRTRGYLVLRAHGTHRTATVYDLVLPEVQEVQDSAPAGDAPPHPVRLTPAGAAPPPAPNAPPPAGDAPSADHSADHCADHSADQLSSDKPTVGLFGDEVAPTTKTKRESGEVSQVFDHYLTCWRREVGKGAEPKLTTARRKQIAARLREGYTADRIGLAIDGLFASGFHRGENTTGTTYLEIEQVIRKGERIETFCAPRKAPATNASGRGPIRQGTPADATWVKEAGF